MNTDPGIDRPASLNLLHRVIHASSWTTFGYGASQLVRLGGSLILTRLLFPEAFGLMAIVQAVLTGAVMLSDVGIAQSIIQNKDGNSPSFVNTAWTVQILRGVLLWILIYLLAVPIASFYSEPILVQLLPVAGLTAVISGLVSTKMATAHRNLGLRRITIIELGSSILGLAVAILGTWADQSIWWLVFGNIAGTTARTIASHLYMVGPANRITWHQGSLNSMLSFGRWIFVGSALTFLVGEGNRLLIGAFIDIRTLALFSLAMTINFLPQSMIHQMAAQVLFPAYSEIERERPERLYAAVLKSRLVLILAYWIPCLIFIYFSNDLIGFLYDERYQESGGMLRILALGSLVGSLGASYNGVLLAKGLARTNTVLLASQLSVQIPAVVLGAHFGGANGVIIAYATIGWIMYPIHAIVYSRIGLLQPKIDLPVIVGSLLVLFTL